MAASRSTISGWFDRGVAQGSAFLIVWCDDYDYTDYPGYYKDAEEAQKQLDSPSSMQRAMEVYDLNQPRGPQLKLSRCWALTKGGKGVIKDVSLSAKIHPSASPVTTTDPIKLLQTVVAECIDDPSMAHDIATYIAGQLGLRAETCEPTGMEHLSPPSIIRWVTEWKAWRTIPK